MIIVQKVITADNTDVLGGTDLAQIPALGQLDIFVGSTQNDTLITITGPGNEPIVRGQNVVLRSNGMPILSDDLPFSLVAVQGGKYVIDINVVTAATVVIVAVHRDLEDLGFV